MRSLRATLTAAAALLALAGSAPAQPTPTPVAVPGQSPAPVAAPAASAAAPVGVIDVTWSDKRSDGRSMVMAIFYPAKAPEAASKPLVVPFSSGLTAWRNLDYAPGAGGATRPLVMLSHGRGGNRYDLAWLAIELAANGFIVASLDHYKANSYDATIDYLTSKLWQRPLDVALDVTYLLEDPKWGQRIDPQRIGVAGFSQGGFTALWVGGAKINAERFLAFQRIWKESPLLPETVRTSMPLDAKPALDVDDPRVQAVFAMAPGVIETFGFDEAGLKQLRVPTFVIAGQGDTVTPPKQNAELVARFVPGATSIVLPGGVQHYDFLNQCDPKVKAELIERCADAPGVDRAQVHAMVGAAAVHFFHTNLVAKAVSAPSVATPRPAPAPTAKLKSAPAKKLQSAPARKSKPAPTKKPRPAPTRQPRRG